MKTFIIRAWKEPPFMGRAEVEAETLEQALELAKAHDWDDEPFEDCGAWPKEVCSLQAEDDETQESLDADMRPPVTQHANELYDALVAMLADYRTEGCPLPHCSVCAASRLAEAKARAVIESITATGKANQ